MELARLHALNLLLVEKLKAPDSKRQFVTSHDIAFISVIHLH